MNIWIIHQNAYAPFHSASTRHFEMARRLIANGHQVQIVASSFDHKSQVESRLADGEMYRHEVIDSVPYMWLRTPPYEGNGVRRLWNMLVFAFRAWRRTGLRDAPRPDVIVGSSPHLFSPWAAMKLSEKFGVPFVLEIRDIWPAVPIEMGGLSRAHPVVLLMAYLEKLYYRRASRVISILPGAAEHIESLIGRSDHVTWIPNGSPLPLVEPAEESHGPFTFLYAGAHSTYSRLSDVIEAARILSTDGWGRRIRIRLVGDGPEKPRLMQSVKSCGLQNVVFEPPVPKSDVFAVLQQADAFLMVYHDAPVLRFGLCPNKLYDYLGAARPLVFAMRTPNNPVAEVNAGITVPPADPHALAEGMKRLAVMPLSERRQMGMRGRRYVERNHNFDLLAAKYEQALESVVNERSPIRRRRAA